MTSARLWWQGARPRTLGASVVPVIVGTAAATTVSIPRLAGALVVALGLQVGVNYANDYFDGVRGVDTPARVGPVRLTAAKLATPRAVAVAAALALFTAAVAGVWLAIVVSPWLFAVGALALLAAVGYSGGPAPYGAYGLGELFVFVFFGLVATAGSAFVQVERVPAPAWWSGIALGLLAVAILVANNLRDIPTDTATRKRTLAVRLGDGATRAMFRLVVAGAFVVAFVGWLTGGLPRTAMLCLAAAPAAIGPLRGVRRGRGAGLVPVLIGTATLHMVFGLLLAFGLWIR